MPRKNEVDDDDDDGVSQGSGYLADNGRYTLSRGGMQAHVCFALTSAG